MSKFNRGDKVVPHSKNSGNQNIELSVVWKACKKRGYMYYAGKNKETDNYIYCTKEDDLQNGDQFLDSDLTLYQEPLITSLNAEDLVSGEVYYWEFKNSSYLAKCRNKADVFEYIDIKQKDFTNSKSSCNYSIRLTTGNATIRKATLQEKLWLEQCVKVNRYVDYQESLSPDNLIPGEVYYWKCNQYEYLARCKHNYKMCEYIYIPGNIFTNSEISTSDETGLIDDFNWTIRVATSEEKKWLAECVRLNKYVDKSVINKIPEKWCVLSTNETKNTLINFITSKGYNPKENSKNYYIHYPFVGTGSLFLSIQDGYTQISYEQFESQILNIKPEHKFEVDKWYKYKEYSFFKFLKVESCINYNKIWYSEKIEYALYKGVKVDYIASIELEQYALNNLVPIEEIQKYLPDNHSDKITVTLPKVQEFPKKWMIMNIYPEVREYLANKYDLPKIVDWNYKYIGWDGCKNNKGCHGTENFAKDTTQIRIDEFRQYVIYEKSISTIKGFTSLPKNWCIKVTPENKEILGKWRFAGAVGEMSMTYSACNGYIHSMNQGQWDKNILDNSIEITTEQFKKWVLNTSAIFEFKKGEWYKGQPNDLYFKYDYTDGKGQIWYTEKIFSSYYKVVKDWLSNEDLIKFAKENPVSLSEIQEYLPKSIKPETNLEKAKRLYPIGTRIRCAKDGKLGTIVNEAYCEQFGDICSTYSRAEDPGQQNQYIYANDKWAEIIPDVETPQSITTRLSPLISTPYYGWSYANTVDPIGNCMEYTLSEPTTDEKELKVNFKEVKLIEIKFI